MSQSAQRSGSCLARLVWFGIGPAIMLILAFVKIDRGGGWFTSVDIAYVIVLGFTILARFVDYRSGDSQTATGAPATAADLQRYVPIALLIALFLWLVANLIGNR